MAIAYEVFDIGTLEPRSVFVRVSIGSVQMPRLQNVAFGRRMVLFLVFGISLAEQALLSGLVHVDLGGFQLVRFQQMLELFFQFTESV